MRRVFVSSLFVAACFAAVVPGRGLRAADEAFPAPAALPVIDGLPDPLTFRDGTPVKTGQEWFDKRRPELKRLFAHYMYGVAPAAPTNLKAEEVRVNRQLFDGKATKSEVLLSFGPPGTPPISLLVVLPNKRPATGKVPMFVGVSFCGNHTVLDEPDIAIPQTWMYKHCPGCENERATEKGRGGQKELWSTDLLVERGYGLAVFYNGDIDPDQPNFDDGVHPHFRPAGTPPTPESWGSVAAWAWGVSRVVDYLHTRDDVDTRRIAAFGHSRLGKTVLYAAAVDERIGLTVPHQSGTGGCALSRDNDQETVERINRVFPHWFNDHFAAFGDKPEQVPLSKLPIDQHLLIALVAPRAVFDTEGEQDKWANFDHSFRAIQAADKAFKFVGSPGLKTREPLSGETPFTDENCGNLVQYRRDTPHVVNRDYWRRILDFADLHWNRTAK
jgi:hypothetical protein